MVRFEPTSLESNGKHTYHYITETTKQLVGLDEILYGNVAIEGDTDVIIFNPMVSSILKWLRFIILK